MEKPNRIGGLLNESDLSGLTLQVSLLPETLYMAGLEM
jgi:hypothetical protein